MLSRIYSSCITKHQVNQARPAPLQLVVLLGPRSEMRRVAQLSASHQASARSPQAHPLLSALLLLEPQHLASQHSANQRLDNPPPRRGPPLVNPQRHQHSGNQHKLPLPLGNPHRLPPRSGNPHRPHPRSGNLRSQRLRSGNLHRLPRPLANPRRACQPLGSLQLLAVHHNLPHLHSARLRRRHLPLVHLPHPYQPSANPQLRRRPLASLRSDSHRNHNHPSSSRLQEHSVALPVEARFRTSLRQAQRHRLQVAHSLPSQASRPRSG